MKNIFAISALLLSLLLLGENSCAQKNSNPSNFNGTITFSIKTENADELKFLREMPSNFTVYVQGNKSRSDIKIMGFNMSFISSGDTDKFIILLDIPGMPCAIVSSISETKTMNNLLNINMPDVEYEETGDTKNICGYECKGYRIIITDSTQRFGSTETLTYITNDIAYAPNIFTLRNPMTQEGIALYNQFNFNNYKLTMEATKVKKEKIKDSYFTIPDNYTTYSMTEFQSLFNSSME